MFDRLRAAVGAIKGRKIAPEMYPEVRFVPVGNVNFRLNAPEDALTLSVAHRCVNLLANTVGALEWAIRQRTGPGTAQDKPDNPIWWLLNSEPNPEMGALDFRRTMTAHRLLYGNGYAEIQRDTRGRPVALWPIGPDRVEPRRSWDGALYYQVSNPRGGISELEPRDMFHVRGLGWDGIRGYSVLEVAAVSLRAGLAMDAFAGSFFANGMQPSAVIEVPKDAKLSPEAMAKLKAEFRENHQGPGKAGTPVFVDGGMKYNPVPSDPEKAQFLDTRKFSVYDVCRWFNVPPYLAFSSEEQPRANVETQSREFYAYGLMPLILELEQEANRRLLSREFGGLFSKMNTDELLRGDYKTLAAYYQTMRNIGAFTVNDVLRMEGLNTIGPEGDVRHMQIQNVPIGGAKEAPDETEAPDENP